MYARTIPDGQTAVARWALRWVLPGLACATAALAAPIPSPEPAARAGTVQVWITSGDGSRLLARAADAVLAPVSWPETPYAGSVFSAEYRARPSDPLIIDIAPGARHQQMLGFGAALSDSSAWLIRHRLDAGQRAALLDELFGDAPALQLELVRVSVGGSEFSRRHDSLDEMGAGQSDPGLSAFSIESQREDLLPLLRQLRALRPDLRIMAVPWSAPAWMKTGDSLIGGSLRGAAHGVYARYLLRYLDVYRDEGLPVWSLSVQNEPRREPSDHPGMRFDPQERASFIATQLGPALAGRDPPVRLLDGEQDWDGPDGPLRVLADRAAAPYVGGTAWHCYGGDVAAQEAVHAARPELDLFITECSGGEWAPLWSDGLLHFVRTALIGGARHWARGVMLGNLALDGDHGPHLGGCRDCRGLVTIAGGTVTRNVEYYALAHASRFVRAGAYRVDSDSRRAGLEHVAFVNPDHSLVLIVANPGREACAFGVRMAGQGFRYTLPAASVATLRWQAPPGTPSSP